MQIFKNRPLALAICIAVLSAVLLFRADAMVSQLLLFALVTLSVLLLLIAVLHRHMGRRILLTLLCLLCTVAVLGSSYLFFHVRYDSLQKLNGQTCQAEGYVLERMDSAAYNSHLRIHVSSLNGKDSSMDAILECSYLSALQVGDRFILSAVPREYTENELFDEENFRLSEGCLMILTSSSDHDYEILPEREDGWRITASKLNTRLSYALRNRIGGEEGGLAAALVLGNRSWLTADTAVAFRRAGVSHLLALSGLHVSILVGFLELLLRRLHIPKVARAWIVPLFAFVYLILTGLSVSTCRAVLMICVLYIGILLRANYDSFTALCSALLLILVVTPYAILDISMWMSFLAAGSIVIFSPACMRTIDTSPLRQKLPPRLFRIGKAIISAIFIGVVANMALLLLSASVFGEISLASVAATLLLSLPIELLMICSAILLCLSFLPLLPSLCHALGRLCLSVVYNFSEIRGVLLPVDDLPTKIILGLLTLTLILFACLKLKKKRWVLLPLALSAAVASSFCVTYLPPEREWTQTVLPAGFGEARLYTKNGACVLVNDMSRNSSESFEIKQSALENRCTEIDDLVFCRYYNQSTYFIARISAQMRVITLHLPQPQNERECAIAARIEQEAELHGIDVVYDAERMLSLYP